LQKFNKKGRVRMGQVAEREHVGAFIEAEQRRQLIELARSQDRSVSSVIRQALKEHVEREATAAEPADATTSRLAHPGDPPTNSLAQALARCKQQVDTGK
jgi:hypothetical protein